MSSSASYRSYLYTLVVVFFFWGFVAASNGIFIPFCKTHFLLTQFQSQLIDLTFYGGYFIGSMLLFLSSSIFKIDFLNKIGYKNGIIIGLIISIAGALLIIPSVNYGSFGYILGSLFVIALGFSLQQTSAQPFVVGLGTPETGGHRLNFAGGVNSLGTTVGPLIVSYFLFGSLASGKIEASLNSINTLYLMLAAVFAIVALFFAFSDLPEIGKSNNVFESGLGVLKYPQLVLGMIAIFVYVGVEVTIQSNMGALLKSEGFGSIDESKISPYISLYWGSLMIGRWTGAISIFNIDKVKKRILTIIVPFIAFAVILVTNYMRGNEINELWIYTICIVFLIIAIFLGMEKPARTLLIFSLMGFIAMIVGLLSTGKLALLAFVSGGLACSVMWPHIFSMAISGLGKYTSQGSAFLIMMILGGAIIPPLQGHLADIPSIGIHHSYIVAPFCFAYIAFFAIKTKKILRKQGIFQN